MSAPASSSPPTSKIEGVLIIPYKAFGDDRGYFFESFRRTWLPPGTREMIQGNCSFSKKGVLRGLHYHRKQADLWAVPSGHVRAALYDFRASSPTFGVSQVIEMGQNQPVGVYIPRGVAHGFYALAESFMTYLVDEYYDNTDELGILWNDPALGVDWGAQNPILSGRDQANPLLASIPAELRP